MEKQGTIKQNCENCRYYSRHYSKHKTRYLNVHCGYCLNKNVRNTRKEPHYVCEHWEDVVIKTEERRRDIKEALILMSERLDELTEILKDDLTGSQP